MDAQCGGLRVFESKLEQSLHPAVSIQGLAFMD
jgi:hypothetical protein